MSRYLISDRKLGELLHRRAGGETSGALATRFGLEPIQVYRLLNKERDRLRAICKRLGVPIPHAGGSRRGHRRNHPWLKGEAPPKTKTISCLGCQENFESRGAGHRICHSCTQSRSWRDGNDYTVFALELK